MSDNEEKGFNDAELEDIMNEIESLEKEFTEDTVEETVEATVDEGSEDPIQAVAEEVETVAEVAESPAPEVEVGPESEIQSTPEAEVQTISDDEGELKVEASIEEPVASNVSGPSEDILDQIAGEVEDVINEAELNDIEEAANAQIEEAQTNVTPISGGSTSTPAPVTPSFSGDTGSGGVNLDLTFNIGSTPATLKIHPDGNFYFSLKGVEMKIDPATGCTLTMDGGMKFTVPLESEESLKKAS